MNYASPYYYSPVVANDLVYVRSGSIGSGGTALYCLNASTGKQVWARTHQQIGFTAANGYIYINEDNGLQSEVSCLNPNTGAQIWNYSSTVYSRLFVVGNYVFLNSYTFTLSTGKSNDVIFALDPITGRKVWESYN